MEFCLGSGRQRNGGSLSVLDLEVDWERQIYDMCWFLHLAWLFQLFDLSMWDFISIHKSKHMKRYKTTY